MKIIIEKETSEPLAVLENKKDLEKFRRYINEKVREYAKVNEPIQVAFKFVEK